MNLFFNWNHKRGSVFVRYFILFIVIFTIISCVSIIAGYYQTSNVLRRNVIEDQALLLENVAVLMDQKLDDLYKNIIQLTNDKDFIMVSASNSVNADNALEIGRLTQKLTNISESHGFAEQLCMYFKKLNRVYYGGIYDTEKFFSDNFGGYNQKVWERTYDFEILKSSELSSGTGKKPLLDRPVILFTLPHLYDTVNPKVYSIVFINEREVLKYIRNSNLVSESKVFILNRENSVVFTNDSKFSLPDPETLGNLVDKKSTLSIGGESFIYAGWNGSNGLRYISLVPSDIVLQTAKNARDRAILMTLTMLSVAIVLSYLLSIVIYRPIKNIVELMKNQNNAKAPKLKGEYNYIGSSLISLYQENKELKNRLDKNHHILKERLAYCLLHGIAHDYKEYADIACSLSLNDSNKYCVVLVRIDKSQGINENEYLYYKNLLISAIRKYEQQRNCLITQNDENMISIIYSQPNHLDGLLSYITGISSDEKKYLHVYSGVGGEVNSLNEVRISFVQAKTALDYRKVSPANAAAFCETTYYNEVVKLNEIVYYPIDKENLIINSLCTGNRDKAIETFEYVYKLNIDKMLPYAYIERLFIEFAGTLHRAINRINGNNPDKLVPVKKLFVELDVNRNNEFYMQMIFKKCEEICSYVNAESRDDEKSESIRSYIHNNYQKDIYLDLVAMKFDYSAAYFSKYFKKKFGCNFVDYLNKLRLQRAKELLEDNTHDIQTIAALVGYKSSNTFARTFKKYMGISPSMYKELKTDAEEDEHDDSQIV